VSVKIKFPNNKTIVYKVPTFKVLQHSVSELEGMALLLPFYILKVRNELEKKGTDSEKKKALSKKLEGYIIEIGKTLKRCNENNYITERDTAMLLRRLLNIYKELYGKHGEFMEADMTLKQIVDEGMGEIWAIDKAIAKAGNDPVAKTKAIADTRAKCIIAKAMKAGGEAMDKIMRYTGLSRREIMAL